MATDCRYQQKCLNEMHQAKIVFMVLTTLFNILLVYNFVFSKISPAISRFSTNLPMFPIASSTDLFNFSFLFSRFFSSFASFSILSSKIPFSVSYFSGVTLVLSTPRPVTDLFLCTGNLRHHAVRGNYLCGLNTSTDALWMRMTIFA